MDTTVITDLMATMQELMGTVVAKSDEFRGCPAEGLMSTWANATMPDGSPMPVETIFHETGLFVSGGSETTRTAIAHGLRTFCDHHDQWELLYERPGPSAHRGRRGDPLGDAAQQHVPQGDPGHRAPRRADRGGRPRSPLVYPSANRDEEVFDDPFTFDVTRSPNPHIAFGYGTHFCIGANFARHELELLFAQAHARLDEPAGR